MNHMNQKATSNQRPLGREGLSGGLRSAVGGRYLGFCCGRPSAVGGRHDEPFEHIISVPEDVKRHGGKNDH